MNTSPRIAVFVLLGIGLITRGALAMPGLEGVVKDANGRPLSGAEVRIETPDSGSVLKVARTDGAGRYRAGDIAASVYRVSLVVNSDVKASIKNVKLSSVDATQLNFELKQGRALPQSKGKHYVWAPSPTGSHVAGRWVEVNDDGTTDYGMSERVDQRSGGAIIKRIQDGSGTARHQ